MLRKVIIALLAVFLVFLFEGALAATLTLPESLETIEASAFEGDRSLDEVVLPEGIVSIRSRAFADSSVTAINLPVSLQEIADDAFDGASAVRIQAVTGSEQYAWAVEHGYLLAFDDPEAYDFHAQRAAFEDNESIGLYHEAWIRNYQIDHYDELAGHRTGEPEWSVAIEGNSYGAQVSYAIGEWAGEGSQAIDVSISNEPTTSCTISVRVTCAWGGETISGVCTLEYVRTSLPTGIAAEDEYHWKINEIYELTPTLLPAGYSFGNTAYIDFWSDMDCDNWEEWQGDTVRRYVRPLRAGTFEGRVVMRQSNIQMRKPVTVYVENNEGVVPGPVPALEDNYTFNMSLAVTDTKGMYVYTDKRTLGISPENWNVCRNQYGDDWNWTFETVSGSQADLAWSAPGDYFEFALNNLEDYSAGTELVVKGTLQWGSASASTLLHFNIVRLQMPSQILFDRSEIRIKTGETYRAEVGIEPAGWSTPYFLYYEFSDESVIEKCEDGNTAYCFRSYTPGYYTIRPHLHVLDNVFIFGDWSVLVVTDENNQAPGPAPYFMLETEFFELDYMLGKFAYDGGEGWFSSPLLFGWTLDNLPALYEAYGEEPQISWGYTYRSGIEVALALTPYQANRYVGDACNVELLEMPSEAGVSEFDIYCEWNGHRGTLPCRIYFHEPPERLPSGSSFPALVTVQKGETVHISGHYSPDNEYDVSEQYYEILFDSHNADVGRNPDNEGEFLLTGRKEGTFTATARVGVSYLNYYQKPIVIQVVSENSAQLAEVLGENWDLAPLSAALNKLTQSDLKDPGKWSELCERVEEIQSLIDSYNATQTEIREICAGMTDRMQISDDGYSLVTSEFSYTVSAEAAQLVAGNCEVIEVAGADDQSMILRVVSDGKEYYLKQSYDGLSITTASEAGSLISRAAGDAANQAAKDAAWSRMHAQTETLQDRFNNRLTYLTGLDNVVNLLADLLNNKGLGIIGDFTDLFVKIADILDVPQKWDNAAKAYQMYINLLDIRNHLHPTDQETWYERTTEIAGFLNSKTDAAIWAMRSEFCNNIYGMYQALTPDDDKWPTWTKITQSSLESYLEVMYHKAHQMYEEVLEYDRQLHYDVIGTVKDEDGQPLYAVKVEIVGEGTFIYTDPDGYFEFEAPSDTVYLVCSKNDYVDSKPQQVTCRPYEKEPVNIVLKAKEHLGTLFGQVTDDESHLPIAGVTVSSGEYSATTSTAGAYTLLLPEGSHRVTFDKEGYISKYQDVVIVENETTDGSETLQSCYVIRTREDLENIANDTGGRYSLGADINLNGDDWTPLPWFSGSLDGKNHTIYGMTVTETYSGNSGLFAGLVGAQITNLSISNAVVSVPIDSEYSASGILCGQINAGKTKQASLVSDCRFSGNISIAGGEVSGNVYAGGIAGVVNYGTIRDCQVNVNLDARNKNSIYVGGISGQMPGGSLSAISYSGSVRGTQKGNNASAQIWASGIGSTTITAMNCSISGSVSAIALDANAYAHGLDNGYHGSNNSSVYAYSTEGAASAIGCINGYAVTNGGSVSAGSWRSAANAIGLSESISSINNASLSATSEYGEANAIGYTGTPSANENYGSYSAYSHYGTYYSGSVEWAYTQH